MTEQLRNLQNLISAGFSIGDLACMRPVPFTTTMHLPKKALRV